LILGLGVLIAFAASLPLSQSPHVYAGEGATPPDPAEDSAVAATASLHNPNFDNGIWYEFHLRYQSSYPVGVWVPAGNTYSDSQDWRIWFLDGTAVVDCDHNVNHVHSAPESVKIWPWSGHQVAGLYQVIPGVTPCLTYQFQVYGYSRQEEVDDSLAALKAGIDRGGWHPDSATDPAVHSWPSTMRWGDSRKYTSGFGLLEVTAEAWDDTIAVFTYADAYGGNSHKIHWDTSSFADVTPSLIIDPDDPPATGGINITSVITTSTTAQINWTTSAAALGQVYYQPAPSGGTPSTLPNKIYLPLVAHAGSSWQATTLNKTPTTSHSVTISGLDPGRKYTYIVASRGLDGGQCETWVSSEKEFTTAP